MHEYGQQEEASGCVANSPRQVIGGDRAIRTPTTLVDVAGNFHELLDVVASTEERVARMENFFGTSSPQGGTLSDGSRSAPEKTDNIVDELQNLTLAARLRLQRINQRIEAIQGRVG